ncbi:MAG: 4Fe-4S binding protein [Anaerolineae bacterium]
MTVEREFRIRKPPVTLAQSQEPIALESLEDYPYKSVALASTRANLTGLWRYWRPFYQTKRAPCDAACPVGNQVVDYIQTIVEGHWQKAATVLRSENPLPAVTGRICHRPCEMSCNRRQYDRRIAIHDIETVLAEIQFETLRFPPIPQPRRIGVIGSGPAELAFAFFMALLHHSVTLFETAEALGGRLRVGPQARHLPSGLLDAEVERIVADRIVVQHTSVGLEELKTEYDGIFGGLESPEHLVLILPGGEEDQPLDKPVSFPGVGVNGESQLTSAFRTPLRVSEAIGYGKWVALLLDSYWRGLNPSDTLSQIQVGGNPRIVSALKYLSLLTDHSLQRSEEVVTYDKLQLDMLESPPSVDPTLVTEAQGLLTTDWATGDDLQQVLSEAHRCFSCGRCNHCDNCWIYCPDAVISRHEGRYEIDYDYCKGCLLCAAVCPRRVISVIEEEKWSG